MQSAMQIEVKQGEAIITMEFAKLRKGDVFRMKNDQSWKVATSDPFGPTMSNIKIESYE